MVEENNSNSFEIGFVDGPHSAQHDDLFIRIGGARVVCDSYYYEIWEHENQYSGLNACRVLAAAADNWIRICKYAVAPSFLYVPFGLNDEYIDWITFELKTDDDVLVSAGWNRENGYAIDPINGIRTSEPINLQPRPDTEVRISLDSLVEALTRFRTRIDRELADLMARIERANSGPQSPRLSS